MKKAVLLGGLMFLSLAPSLVFAQATPPAASEQEEDQYDKDYEACSEAAEKKAEPLAEDKREDAFVKYFHDCMKEKGHDISTEGDDLPPADEIHDVGEGIEE